MDEIDRKLAAVSSRVEARRLKVLAALETHCPEFPVDLLKATFGAKIETLRSPEIDFGTDPTEGWASIRLSELAPLWVIPFAKGKDQAKDVPVVVFPMDAGKRRHLKRLRRVRRASKIHAHEQGTDK